ncbi:hypothetical protein Vi05172_g2722 [Venturia inaequalis]|nr:hypothetical protein Vi05172_g2722 [Venturia inaequalis]
MASALEIASTMEFENRELQPEARILACLETLPKVHNEEEFDDYFTETFNAACHNQGLVDEEHAQIAEAWLSKVKISHDSNEDAEDADEKVLRAFPLLRDVESLPLLEDFCNDDKKNWEMVQWIMQPMVKVLQEGSIQMYLIRRRKWYVRHGDSKKAKASLARPPGLADRGRRACPAIPSVWWVNDDNGDEEAPTTESVDAIDIERLVQA